MPFYQFYHIEHYRLRGADGFHATDDSEAMRTAKLLNGTAVSELWESGRKVATLQPDYEAPNLPELLALNQSSPRSGYPPQTSSCGN